MTLEKISDSPPLSPMVEAFWAGFLATRPDPAADRASLADVFAFDDNAEGAAFCARAVLSGAKTATSALAAPYDAGEQPCPKPGDLNIVTELDGTPRAVIEITAVDRIAFGAVDEAFAIAEGDGALASWLATHRRYYGARCAERGLALTADTVLLRIFFRRVHPG